MATTLPWLDKRGDRWLVEIELSDSSPPQCVGFAVRPDAGNERPVTAALIRRVPVGALVAEARSAALGQGRHAPAPNAFLDALGRYGGFVSAAMMPIEFVQAMAATTATAQDSAAKLGDWAQAVMATRPPEPTDHERLLLRAAAHYVKAWRDGRPTRAAVRQALNVANSTAARYVSQARELGYIEQTDERQASGHLTVLGCQMLWHYEGDAIDAAGFTLGEFAECEREAEEREAS